MHYRLLSIAAGLLAGSLALPAQTAPKVARTTKPYTPPKTPWGDPDLQGNWPAGFNIPMQRPANLKDKEVLSDEEFAAQESRAVRPAGAARQQDQVTINPPSYWVEGGKATKQTSMVVDP